MKDAYNFNRHYSQRGVEYGTGGSATCETNDESYNRFKVLDPGKLYQLHTYKSGRTD